MVEALKAARKDVRTEHCRWRKKFEPYDMNMIGSQPSVANPLVFHLYGYADNLKSLVLTENDYIEFLINLSGEERIPGIIKEPLADTSLVFLGYQLDDWDFRILYHTISRYLAGDGRKSYVTVQLDPPNEEASTKQRARAKKIFDYYFNERKVRVFWGTCADFMLALKEHMRGRSHDH
jgi:hypothetical protein